MYLVHNVSELHDSHTNQSVFTSETIILDANVKLETIKMFFVTHDAEILHKIQKIYNHVKRKSEGSAFIFLFNEKASSGQALGLDITIKTTQAQ
jgi:hypothetical protein